MKVLSYEQGLTVMEQYTVIGNIVDIVNQRIFRGTVRVSGGKIAAVIEEPVDSDVYILPGLIDAHVHVESSMLVPSEFARLAVVHGTVAAVSDPHEVANVMGIVGVRFMIDNGRKVPFKFFFGASSCVPATGFETAGARLDLPEIEELLGMEDIVYMSEMMNFPGVLNGDPLVMAKIALARERGLPVDGHAPGLMGDEACRYAEAGISTDHECFTRQEAVEKIGAGMKVQIREGSAAKNFEALLDLLADFPDQIMFCSDDKHPDDLAAGHINQLVKRAMQMGFDPLRVLRSCIYNPVCHYNLDVGLLRVGDPADYIIVDNLTAFNVLETRINGIKVAENGKTCIESVPVSALNNFNAIPLCAEDIAVSGSGHPIRVQRALDGQLITRCEIQEPCLADGLVVSDIQRDILKMVAVNRYEQSPPVIGFTSGFGLQRGAIASSVAHDSHNIIAVGVGEADIVRAVNLLIEQKGGISFVSGEQEQVLALPIAGLMSGDDGYKVAGEYRRMDVLAKDAGATLGAPFMTLSFMALLVIPELKISDKGIFDGNTFSFTSLFSS